MKGLANASMSASCMIVIPPPEYLNAVNGGRSKKTGPTLDGSRPSRISARRTIIAVIGLLMEAAWNSVVETTGRPVSTSAVPKPFTQ